MQVVPVSLHPPGNLGLAGMAALRPNGAMKWQPWSHAFSRARLQTRAAMGRATARLEAPPQNLHAAGCLKATKLQAIGRYIVIRIEFSIKLFLKLQSTSHFAAPLALMTPVQSWPTIPLHVGQCDAAPDLDRRKIGNGLCSREPARSPPQWKATWAADHPFFQSIWDHLDEPWVLSSARDLARVRKRGSHGREGRTRRQMRPLLDNRSRRTSVQ